MELAVQTPLFLKALLSDDPEDPLAEFPPGLARYWDYSQSPSNQIAQTRYTLATSSLILQLASWRPGEYRFGDALSKHHGDTVFSLTLKNPILATISPTSSSHPTTHSFINTSLTRSSPAIFWLGLNVPLRRSSIRNLAASIGARSCGELATTPRTPSGRFWGASGTQTPLAPGSTVWLRRFERLWGGDGALHRQAVVSRDVGSHPWWRGCVSVTETVRGEAGMALGTRWVQRMIRRVRGGGMTPRFHFTESNPTAQPISGPCIAPLKSRMHRFLHLLVPECKGLFGNLFKRLIAGRAAGGTDDLNGYAVFFFWNRRAG